MSDLLGPKKPKKPRRSPTLTKLAQRSLVADPQEVQVYQPREVDLLIAEAMLAGNVFQGDIAKHVGRSENVVREVLKDPTVCAWISQQIHRSIAMRLGTVDSAMFNSAISGNVQAAKLVYERFGEIVKRIHIDSRRSQDMSSLSTEELRKIAGEVVQEKERRDAQVTDAEFTVKEDPDEPPA